MSIDGSIDRDIEECLAQCKENTCIAHNLDMDDWPLELCMSTKTKTNQTLDEMLKGRIPLIMCSTLGNWSPRVPQFIAEQCIAIYVKNCTRKNV